MKLEYSDESSFTLTGTIFGSNTPTLLLVDDLPFSSPVPLTNKLHFFQISSVPSKFLGQIFEKLDGEGRSVIAFHSSWNGQSGVGVLKIDGDVNNITEVFGSTQMSFVSF